MTLLDGADLLRAFTLDVDEVDETGRRAQVRIVPYGVPADVADGVDDPVKQLADPRINLASNLRYFPSRVDGLRSPFLNLWDISIVKQVPLSGRVRMQFNIEFLNATNRVVYNDANTDPRNAAFGTVTSQNNLPRDIQLAAKIVW